MKYSIDTKGNTLMNNQDILALVDHTLLSQTATWEEIKVICDDAIHYQTASVCIPPSYVKAVKDYVGDKMKVCTVIGFPNGYNTTAAKVFETADAVNNGADEIDMVINLGMVKDSRYDELTGEIRAIKKACNGKLLKVIIETCLLTEEEKIQLCKSVTEAGADFIKTSTGFSKAGATVADVALMRDNVGTDVKVKAAGGISSLTDAEDMIKAGADRLGTSRIVKIIKSNNADCNSSY